MKIRRFETEIFCLAMLISLYFCCCGGALKKDKSILLREKLDEIISRHKKLNPDCYLGYYVSTHSDSSQAVEISRLRSEGKMSENIREEIYQIRERFIKEIRNNDTSTRFKKISTRIIAGTASRLPGDKVAQRMLFFNKQNGKCKCLYSSKIKKEDYMNYMRKTSKSFEDIIEDFINYCNLRIQSRMKSN